MIVACYAEGRGDEWDAVCLNFDIAVQGESFEDVVKELNVAIGSYLEYVRDLPEAEQAQFLDRSVPWSMIIKLAWLSVLTILFRGSGGNDGKPRGQFTVACPA